MQWSLLALRFRSHSYKSHGATSYAAVVATSAFALATSLPAGSLPPPPPACCIVQPRRQQQRSLLVPSRCAPNHLAAVGRIVFSNRGFSATRQLRNYQQLALLTTRALPLLCHHNAGSSSLPHYKAGRFQARYWQRSLPATPPQWLIVVLCAL